MKKPIKLVIALLVVGVIAFLFLFKGKTVVTEDGVKVGKSVVDQVKEEVFSGSIKMAIEKGIPMKCTTPRNEETGVEVIEGYLKGQKYYGKIQNNDKEGYIIMVDKCMWTWDEGSNQGFKLCFEEDIWDTENIDTDAVYTCVPAVFSDSIFTPPTNVEFLDLDDMQERMMQE